jgi:WD40 repeat protein
LWDVTTGKERATLKGHTDVVFSVAFSPDGEALVSASEDGKLKLWDTKTGKATGKNNFPVSE